MYDRSQDKKIHFFENHKCLSHLIYFMLIILFYSYLILILNNNNICIHSIYKKIGTQVTSPQKPNIVFEEKDSCNYYVSDCIVDTI